MIISFAKIERITFVSFVILNMISLLAGGCDTIRINKYPEPKTIAVRNNSGISLSIVTLRQVRNSGDKSVRMGRISPVPRGVTQIFERPSSLPPLPPRVIISWTDYDQKQYEREVSLEKILSDPNTQAKDTLIFEIGPSGTINVFKK